MSIESTSEKTVRDVAVVGGGPAGMIAALTAAREGARVTLLERNEKLGKKLYITGKGRCNVTNIADFEEFFAQVPRNPRFLNAAVRRFSAQDLIALLESLGVETVVQRGGRVFPKSEKASDVTRALERALQRAGVRVRLGCRVQAVLREDGAVNGVLLGDGTKLPAQSCLLYTSNGPRPLIGRDAAPAPGQGRRGDRGAFPRQQADERLL